MVVFFRGGGIFVLLFLSFLFIIIIIIKPGPVQSCTGHPNLRSTYGSVMHWSSNLRSSKCHPSKHRSGSSTGIQAKDPTGVQTRRSSVVSDRIINRRKVRNLVDVGYWVQVVS